MCASALLTLNTEAATCSCGFRDLGWVNSWWGFSGAAGWGGARCHNGCGGSLGRSQVCVARDPGFLVVWCRVVYGGRDGRGRASAGGTGARAPGNQQQQSHRAGNLENSQKKQSPHERTSKINQRNQSPQKWTSKNNQTNQSSENLNRKNNHTKQSTQNHPRKINLKNQSKSAKNKHFLPKTIKQFNPQKNCAAKSIKAKNQRKITPENQSNKSTPPKMAIEKQYRN